MVNALFIKHVKLGKDNIDINTNNHETKPQDDLINSDAEGVPSKYVESLPGTNATYMIIL